MAKETDSVKMIEAKQQIERTKADLAETISGLKRSLSRTRDRVDEKVRDETARRAQVMLSDINRTGREVGRTMLDTLKENPIPLSVTGLGIAWLVADRMKAPADRERPPLGEVYPGAPPIEAAYPGEAAYRSYYGQGAEAVAVEEVSAEGVRGETGFPGRIGKTAGYAEFRNFAVDHPLVVGLGAVVIGATIGFLLPSTRHEDEMLGEKRKEVIDRTKKVGRTAVEETKSAIREAADRVKEEAGKSIKGAIHAVKDETVAATEKAAGATSEEIRKQTGTVKEGTEHTKF